MEESEAQRGWVPWPKTYSSKPSGFNLDLSRLCILPTISSIIILILKPIYKPSKQSPFVCFSPAVEVTWQLLQQWFCRHILGDHYVLVIGQGQSEKIVRQGLYHQKPYHKGGDGEAQVSVKSRVLSRWFLWVGQESHVKDLTAACSYSAWSLCVHDTYIGFLSPNTKLFANLGSFLGWMVTVPLLAKINPL